MTSAEARTVAFIDIGTNSIRLLLVRLYPNHSYTILTELRQIVRLGEGEFVDQHLQPAAMERTVQVAKEFAELARANGADEIVAVATAATREAPIIRTPLCSASRQSPARRTGSCRAGEATADLPWCVSWRPFR